MEDKWIFITTTVSLILNHLEDEVISFTLKFSQFWHRGLFRFAETTMLCIIHFGFLLIFPLFLRHRSLCRTFPLSNRSERLRDAFDAKRKRNFTVFNGKLKLTQEINRTHHRAFASHFPTEKENPSAPTHMRTVYARLCRWMLHGFPSLQHFSPSHRSISTERDVGFPISHSWRTSSQRRRFPFFLSSERQQRGKEMLIGNQNLVEVESGKLGFCHVQLLGSFVEQMLSR